MRPSNGSQLETSESRSAVSIPSTWRTVRPVLFSAVLTFVALAASLAYAPLWLQITAATAGISVGLMLRRGWHERIGERANPYVTGAAAGTASSAVLSILERLM